MIIYWKEKIHFSLIISLASFILTFFILYVFRPDSVTRIDEENKRRVINFKIITLSFIVCISVFLVTYIFYIEKQHIKT